MIPKRWIFLMILTFKPVQIVHVGLEHTLDMQCNLRE